MENLKKENEFINIIKKASTLSKTDENLKEILKMMQNWLSDFVKLNEDKTINVDGIRKMDEKDLRIGLTTVENITQMFNTAIGDWVLNSVDGTADNNVGVGYAVLSLNQSGDGNVGVGNWVLYFNQSGEHNIGIGYSAQQRRQSGDYNIAIGKESLFKNKNGHHNIVIGTGAGLNIEPGSKNIVLGSNPGNPNDNDKLYIGNTTNGKSIIEGNMNGNQELKLNAENLVVPNLKKENELSQVPIGGIYVDSNGFLKVKQS